MTPFHLAFPVTDLEQPRALHGEALGCGLEYKGIASLDQIFAH